MRLNPLAMALGLACPFMAAAQPVKELGVVTIQGGQPSSLPTQIPTTMEGIDRAQIERTVNATDAEDALKYFPSLLVRKRYIGDYNHAVLSSRASGTGNSARSAVYADGILLSNFLGNGVGGLAFPPRWGLVSPEEIERVDVMYGPFSAAYPGNSAGAVVEYVTRMPRRFEAHGRVGYVAQPFSLYGTDTTLRSWQASASAGNKSGELAWLFHLSRTDSEGQPLTFATRLASAGTPGGAGQPVAGATLGRNSADQPWWLVGSATQYSTRQDHLKAKLAYDIAPTLRLAYTVGLWDNTSEGRSASYLRNAAGQAVSAGPISIDGRGFAPLTAADFPSTGERLLHLMHGLSLKRRTQGVFDWELSASAYDYHRDEKRQEAATPTFADGSGTGWRTLAWKGIWRPDGVKGAHIVEGGVQHEQYELAYRTSAIAGDWRTGLVGAVASDVGGRTQLTSLWAQDAWAFAPRWKAVLGARAERWQASSGFTRIAGVAAVDTVWPQRAESHVSPKAALSWQWLPATVLKASVGRAVRFPTVAELYGATATANAQFINDPALRPERSWTGELSAEQDLGKGQLRLTWFAEDTRDALYTQATLDAVANRNVSRVQNVDRIATQGLELAYNASDVALRGLDLGASVTWADSVIKRNTGFVAVPGDTLGRRQPNIPRWRATGLASWRVDDAWSASVAARYSGRQFRTLDNSDVNGEAYMGVSSFFSVDLRARRRLSPTTVAAVGVDNANNARYWNFHPYPQRSYVLELKVDL